MKLSEAIKLGIPVVREDRTLYLHATPDDPCGCALGTAMYAIGRRFMGSHRDAITEWPWLAQRIASPINSSYVDSVAAIISITHFQGHWTRQQIADWVATIEPQDTLETQPTHEDNHEVLDEPAHSPVYGQRD